MSISTYAELQTAVANELRVSNLTARIPEFISQGENRINRNLRVREMEEQVEVTYSASATDNYIAIPAGYIDKVQLAMKKKTQDRKDYVPLKYVAPTQFFYYTGDKAYYHNNAISNYRFYMHYTMRDQFEMARSVDEDHDVLIHYYKRWDIETDSTNWLLTNHEDLYLFSAMIAAQRYIKKEERDVSWRSDFDAVVSELNLIAQRGRDDVVLDCGDYSSRGYANTERLKYVGY